jgi:hypothetical protein
LCFPIPPVATVRAAFTAHGDPMRGFLAFRVPLASARLPKPPRLTGRGQCMGYFANLSRCGPSPCNWLSQSLSTMTTLTADMGLGGLRDGFPIPYRSLSLASYARSPMFPSMDSARQLRWRFPKDPFALLALPTTAWGTSRCVHALNRLFHRLSLLTEHGSLKEWSLSYETGEDRGYFPRRITPASGGFTILSLRQAWRLESLSLSHHAF